MITLSKNWLVRPPVELNEEIVPEPTDEGEKKTPWKDIFNAVLDALVEIEFNTYLLIIIIVLQLICIQSCRNAMQSNIR
jgi:hypothetical protein